MTSRFILFAAVATLLLPFAAQAQTAAPEALPAPPQSATLTPAPPPAPPKMTTIASYAGTGGQVIVAAYIDNDRRVGVLGVAAVRRASVALSKDEWATFLDLWQQARAVKASAWQTVGTFKETGTKEPSELTLMGGPGVQFRIADGRGAFTVSLTKGDYAKLDSSLHKVSAFLDGGAIEPDRPPAKRHHVHRKPRPQTAAGAPARGPQRCTGFWCNN